MDVERALELLAGEDERASEEAYTILIARHRAPLLRYLQFNGIPETISEEVVQETFVRIWTRRKQFKNEGIAHFKSFLFRTAKNLYIDHYYRPNRSKVVVPYDDSHVSPEAPPLIDAIFLAILTEHLYDCVNALWLGLDLCLPPGTHTRQLMTAQLYYLEGDTVPEILEVFKMSANAPSGEPDLTEEILYAWLRDPSVLRYMAFDALYYPNARLSAWMLGWRERGEVPTCFQTLMEEIGKHLPEEKALGEWTWVQVALIVWYCHHALTPSQMYQQNEVLLTRWGITEQEIASRLEELTACLPFRAEMESLLTCLGRPPGPTRSAR